MDAALRTDIRGVVLYRTFPDRENIGATRLTLSAGGCTASTDVTLDESLFPPACPDDIHVSQADASRTLSTPPFSAN